MITCFPHADQVKVAHPLMLRAIAAAKKKQAVVASCEVERQEQLEKRHTGPAETHHVGVIPTSTCALDSSVG